MAKSVGFSPRQRSAAFKIGYFDQDLKIALKNGICPQCHAQLEFTKENAPQRCDCGFPEEFLKK